VVIFTQSDSPKTKMIQLFEKCRQFSTVNNEVIEESYYKRTYRHNFDFVIILSFTKIMHFVVISTNYQS